MTDYAAMAARLESALGLATPAVAVTVGDDAPADADRPTASAPAGCTFWQTGTTRRVATSAEDHRHCSIGIHTHNLEGAPAAQAGELETALAAMQGLDYVRPEEVGAIPVLGAPRRSVVYEPLREASAPPSLVLIFANAAQGLVVTEALTRVDGEAPPAMGRPACAVVPQVLNGSRSASSLGCCGARVYVDAMDDHTTLWALHGEKLADYVDALETLAKANATLTSFHVMRREDVESGASPTVADSLARLG